jgi:hypothetical protein
MEMVGCAFDCDAPTHPPPTIVVNFKFQHCLFFPFDNNIRLYFWHDGAAGPILKIGIPSSAADAQETGRCEVKRIEEGNAKNCPFFQYFRYKMEYVSWLWLLVYRWDNITFSRLVSKFICYNCQTTMDGRSSNLENFGPFLWKLIQN